MRAFQYLQCGKPIPEDLAIMLGPATYKQNRKHLLIQAPKQINTAVGTEVEEEDGQLLTTLSDIGKEFEDTKDVKVEPMDESIPNHLEKETDSLKLISEGDGACRTKTQKTEEEKDFKIKCEVFDILSEMVYHVARGKGYPSMMETSYKRLLKKQAKITATGGSASNAADVYEKRLGEFDVILPRGPHGNNLIISLYML